MRKRILKLHCGVQHYDWGSTDFIPALLGIDNTEGEPFAELWMGAHPNLPAEVELEGRRIPLDRLIAESPEDILGTQVAGVFEGRLPYLFKVLSARFPLSIQTHPTRDAAREGFARENLAGVPLSAGHRNYRDQNHKPELIVALTDFHALRGFREPAEITRSLAEIPEFAGFVAPSEPSSKSLKQLYETFMALPQEDVDAILEPLVGRLAKADYARPFSRKDREYWVLKADRIYSREGHRDRGLFSIYLLNLLHLKPEEAMYLPAGTLHAYLEGSGLEIMANSNNVLRGGLTPKHVDTAELIANVDFHAQHSGVMSASHRPTRDEWVYQTEATEFELSRIELRGHHAHESRADSSAEILILVSSGLNGLVTVRTEGGLQRLERGGVLLLCQGVNYALESAGNATLYKAGVPSLCG